MTFLRVLVCALIAFAAVAQTFPGGTDASRQAATISLQGRGNGEVVTWTHNFGTANAPIECRDGSGLSVASVAVTGRAATSATLTMPASGTPFLGWACYSSGGGKGEPGSGGPGPEAYQFPPVDYDADATYSSTAPRQQVRYGGRVWLPLQPTVGPGVAPVEGANWTLFVDKGDAGVGAPGPMPWNPIPVAYNAGSTYVAGTATTTADSVYYNGSTYVPKIDVMGVLPTDSSKWQIVAQSGQAVAGVTGPAGGVVDGQLVRFNGASGQAIKGSPITGIPYLTADVPAAITGPATNSVRVDGTTAPALDPTASTAVSGYVNLSTGRMKYPQATFASPPSTPLAGQRWEFTDASVAGTCTGGGTAKSDCEWTGAAWLSVGGGGGGGLPGNTEGAVMFNTGSAWVARILRGFTADSTQLVGDGTFGEGAANNTWTGKNAYPPSTQQNITGVSGTLNCDATTIAISANGVYEMTSTPTIAAGTRDGDLCFIRNVGANNITLQGSTLIASGLKHPAASPKITIEAGGGTALYQWATGAVKWTLIGAGGGSGSGGTITSVFGQAGPTITDPVTTAEIATPSTPAGGSVTRYAKGGKFCALSSAGVETCTQATPVVFKGTAAMGTGAIASGACAAAVSVAATGVLTTDVVTAGFAADPTATTGYLPGAMLSIIPFPTAGGDSVSFRVCNNTGGSITPGALTINWRVAR